jgi:CDP-diacylglycerol--glycerol-3-phosphate 3-phosphatidyltransferase
MNPNKNSPLDTINKIIRIFIKQIAVFINWVSKGRIKPNTITIFGLLAHLVVAWYIVEDKLVVAAILLIIFGLFDTLDGELARVQKSESAFGMLLDASTDRFKEVILYAAIAYFFISQNELYFTVWTVIACGFSISVSYVKAKGEVAYLNIRHHVENINRVFKDGFLKFEIRMAIIVLGLFFNKLTWAIVFIAIFASYTSIDRLIKISKKLQ